MLYINIHDHIKNPQRQHEGQLKTGREEVGTGKNGTRCVPHGRSVFAVPRHEVLVRQNAVRCNGPGNGIGGMEYVTTRCVLHFGGNVIVQ